MHAVRTPAGFGRGLCALANRRRNAELFDAAQPRRRLDVLDAVEGAEPAAEVGVELGRAAGQDRRDQVGRAGGGRDEGDLRVAGDGFADAVQGGGGGRGPQGGADGEADVLGPVLDVEVQGTRGEQCGEPAFDRRLRAPGGELELGVGGAAVPFQPGRGARRPV
ncbi:hypothetical protein GCM10010289_36760 [Streptomyces violascens]|uniref:Uncharacterized protein n=1 Tax=Streptomyces violascens TaxID=67381 RepID=A0ABQ3QWR8_9ACTN|nr:hypothetical protein GCM10010289_36760 [Streptomyces violascens]GHI41727.1 hypothetical protein Sviol_61350 [Streptomyces violascens]